MYFHYSNNIRYVPYNCIVHIPPRNLVLRVQLLRINWPQFVRYNLYYFNGFNPIFGNFINLHIYINSRKLLGRNKIVCRPLGRYHELTIFEITYQLNIVLTVTQSQRCLLVRSDERRLVRIRITSVHIG